MAQALKLRMRAGVMRSYLILINLIGLLVIASSRSRAASIYIASPVLARVERNQLDIYSRSQNLISNRTG